MIWASRKEDDINMWYRCEQCGAYFDEDDAETHIDYSDDLFGTFPIETDIECPECGNYEDGIDKVYDMESEAERIADEEGRELGEKQYDEIDKCDDPNDLLDIVLEAPKAK